MRCATFQEFEGGGSSGERQEWIWWTPDGGAAPDRSLPMPGIKRQETTGL